MPDEQGALNTEVTQTGAPPAQEMPVFETQIIEDPAEFERLAAEAAAAAENDTSQEDANQQHVDDEAGQGGAEVVNAPEHEQAVPYQRFREVNQQAQEREQRIRDLEAQQQLLTRAFAAGYATVEAYNTANAWAKANNFASIEAYRDYQAEQAELQQYTNELNERDDLSDAARHELLAARQQNLETQRIQRELAEQVQTLRAQTLDQTIASAREVLGGLDPELEQIFRQSSPQIVQRTVAALKRQSDAQIAELRGQLGQAQAETAAKVQNATGKYAATKLKQQSTPAPEGRGGQAPAPATAAKPTDFKNRSFVDLIFRGNAKA